MRAVEKQKGLTLRRLSGEERGQTRKLYETVFSEDTRQFVDYYYRRKAAENEIYAALDEGGIHSMVHLNPYRVSWRGEEMKLHYIVAVATEESYRRRGIMGALLTMAMRQMNRRGEPFSFLMPAAEAIYTPYGFRRTWSWTWEEELGQTGGGRLSLKWRAASQCPDETLASLSRRVNRRLAGQFELFALRSVDYYRDLQEQQQASEGELQVGFDSEGPCLARCTEKEAFPPMMARIINLEAFLARVRSETPRTFLWQVRDEIIPENCGLFSVCLGPEGGRVRRLKGEEAAERLDIAQIPARLGAADPFLRTMICQVV